MLTASLPSPAARAAAAPPAAAEPLPAGAPPRVLVIDDSRATRELLVAFLGQLELAVDCAATRAEAERLLDAQPGRWLCAVLGLALADAPNGEMVDAVRKRDVPVVVLTGSYSEAVRQTLAAKGIVDYVVKRHPSELRNVVEIVRRLRDNPQHRVLVVDDSKVFRTYTIELLRRMSYRTLGAANGVEALAVLEANPDVTLVITDVHMPVMDGYDLITALRRRSARDALAIIGLSERARADVSARLLKSGANDFLSKPFEVEEFQCRVAQNLDLLDYIRQLKEASKRDVLTGLFNRRHLYDAGEAAWRAARDSAAPFGVALFDVDHFKRINDGHGHPAGDAALREIASCLRRHVQGGDVMARYGGEEFACVMSNRPRQSLVAAIEALRADIARIDFRFGGKSIPITASAGVCCARFDGSAADDGGGADAPPPAESFEALLAHADRALYEAKQNGRNQVRLAGAAGSSAPAGGR